MTDFFTMLSAVKVCCSPIPQRWVLALMEFLALVMAYGMRVSLSIAITEMAKPIHDDPQHRDDSCVATVMNKNETINSSKGEYEWDKGMQGIILSSFYWGYVITQLPGALIAEKFGGKHTLGLGIVSTAILTCLIPAATRWGDATAMIVLRVLMGLCEGVTLPALNVMISQWTPADERSKTGSFVYVGAPLGTVFATATSGLLLKYFTWPVVFYFFGVLGGLWYVIWLLFCYNTPREHPFITDNEANYLESELCEHVHENPPAVPWRRMLTSMPMWALIAVQIGHDWGFYTIATDLPSYMANVLFFKIDENGYLSSLPYIGMWLMCTLMSWLADWLIKNDHISITNVRKLGTTLASVGPGIFIVAASYAECNKSLVVAMFVIGVTFLGCGIPSLKVNALDLSPNYAGTVMAISNGFAACTGIITPYLVGVLTTNERLSEWRIVYWIIFAVLIVTNLFYLIFASGEVQPWNDPQLMKKETMEKKRRKTADNEVVRTTSY